MSLAILILYAWSYLSDAPTLKAALLINTSVAILAGITALVSLALYIWVPKKPGIGALIVYILLVSMTAWLTVSTGGVSSPFIALWILVIIFSAVFGWWGAAPILLSTLIYGALTFIKSDNAIGDIVAILFTCILPLIFSFILWHNRQAGSDRRTNIENPQDSELNKVTNQSEVVINAIGDGVLAIDSQSVIRLINPAAQQLIGWNQGDAVSLSYKSVLHLINDKGEDLSPEADPVIQALNTNQEYRTSDLGLMTGSNKKILISIVVSPIGEPGAGVIVVIRDITKEKTEESQQTEFISTASHEMRTPVASIEGYLGLALNPATAQIDEKARAYITKAHESTQHLGNLLRDLLDITKADDGRLNSKPKLIDMVEFVHGISEAFRSKATDKGLEYIFKPSDNRSANDRQLNPVYYVNADKDHLREIIDNLIENGIKYTLSGRVVIDVSGDEENVIFSVQDSGIGIPAEDIPHLFQKFYRVDNSDTREIGGTGLGLYLCRRLVESMNGRLWVDSKYKEGSTFFVALPRLSRAESSRLQEEAEVVEKIQQPPQIAQPLAVETPTPEPNTQPPTYVQPPVPLQTPVTVSYAQPTQQQAPIGGYQPQAAPIQYQPQPQSANTPLTAIEQHPEQYRYSGPTVPRARSMPVRGNENPPY